jgi:hypothetical protein
MTSSSLSAWSTLGPATVSFCEARLAAPIAEPANSWSSLGYVAVAIGLLVLAIRERRHVLTLVGVTGLLIGLGSFALHATASFLGQFLDEGSMFLFSGLAVTFALRRLLDWDPARCVVYYVAIASASIVLLSLVKTSGIPVFALEIGTAVIVEVVLWSRGGTRARYGALHAVLGLFAVAFFIWCLDMTRTVCSSAWSHVVNGHVLWHLLTAICLVPYYQFQRQFLATPAVDPVVYPLRRARAELAPRMATPRRMAA